MDEALYAYAIALPECPLPRCVPGVDPRFPVELLPAGRLTAVLSRIGLDQFDVSKLEQGTADLPWLSQVAVRHNEIVSELAGRAPLLPLRMGTLFHTRDSLVTRLRQSESIVTEFLNRLGGRQEWAVKIYLDPGRAESRPTGFDSAPAREIPWPASARATAGTGTRYLVEKRSLGERRHEMHATLGRELQSVADRLQGLADSWCRLRPLPSALTGRSEKMVWNGAVLLSPAAQAAFQTACKTLASEVARRGLLLEVTGPWPPYHFCPTLAP